jgi:hypothetical protein
MTMNARENTQGCDRGRSRAPESQQLAATTLGGKHKIR